MKTTHNGFDFSMVTLSTTAFSNAVFKSRVLYWGVQSSVLYNRAFYYTRS